MKLKSIHVAEEFTEFPWARYRSDWDFSWQEFYETFLDNTDKFDRIEVYLDWTYWYPSSFLSEAFWSFYKKYKDKWRKKLQFISKEDPSLIPFINHLIKRNEK